ncbi:MAG: DUF2189 domain-containing protein [Alphaproteobacteria bacterium]|nr:DUF2189 domain-containing protein [Alphaproteobacteria bacterium]
MAEGLPIFVSPVPRIRRVPVDRPWLWLAAGWNDLWKAGSLSLACGAVVVAIGFLLTLGLFLFDMIYLILPLAAGFMLVAPLLAVGIYEVSRRLTAGEPLVLIEVLSAWKRNPLQLASMGVLMLLMNLFWIRTAMLVYALFFNRPVPPLEQMLEMVLFSDVSLPFLIVGTGLGAIFAAIVFALSAVSIPMLLDREVNLLMAIWTSIAVIKLNWRPMALWAVLIVAFTVFGLIPFYLGLIVVMPLVGHATWHAYKDMVMLPPLEAAQPETPQPTAAP